MLRINSRQTAEFIRRLVRPPTPSFIIHTRLAYLRDYQLEGPIWSDAQQRYLVAPHRCRANDRPLAFTYFGETCHPIGSEETGPVGGDGGGRRIKLLIERRKTRSACIIIFPRRLKPSNLRKRLTLSFLSPPPSFSVSVAPFISSYISNKYPRARETLPRCKAEARGKESRGDSLSALSLAATSSQTREDAR